eukprot:TRINITY_DN11169_c0_g1_i1.p1 TRINITY_DN11169_c0_g1~~TRINITY_DN11169_c0_g1_i1.p1  ORF type:complete len:323 (+),score=-36.33 TRINITY_DN11169_c0_g1_i1:31-969(+)
MAPPSLAHSPSLLALIIIAVAISSSTSAVAEIHGWEWVRYLRAMEPRQFSEAVTPLIQIAINTYRTPQTALNIMDWVPARYVRPLLRNDDATPGIRAVCYEHLPTGSIVVAFRGARSPADFCAASAIFGDGVRAVRDSNCMNYTAASLDYPAQAVKYTWRALRAYAGRPLLLSGHSMGSVLALLTSAALSTNAGIVLPVLSFSGPVDEGLLERKGLRLVAGEVGEAYVVSNRWDAFGFPASAGFRHAGVLCAYQSKEPAACSACNLDQQSQRTRRNVVSLGGQCGECFGETHALESILALGAQGVPAVCNSL